MRRSSELRRYDGEYRWHLARAVALRDRDGTILRWIGTNTDVDDQKNAEGLLERRLEQRTAERDRIWRVSQDMLGVADSRGVWISVNPAWTRILGWTERELVGWTSEWLSIRRTASRSAPRLRAWPRASPRSPSPTACAQGTAATELSPGRRRRLRAPCTVRHET